ncbi:hypothetical protein DB347_15410 [Opitutaceae bacterium EW11]|nr:hypothetical protein DB347_15410 [Opitutaceae bacterium EW11]
MPTSLKYALRQLGRSPGFALVSLAMLALGIGMSTSTFSIANLLLLRSMPFPDGERLVRIFRTDGGSSFLLHSPGTFMDLREQSASLEKIAAFNLHPENVSETGQTPELVAGFNATADFFNALGVQPMLGRGFAPDEDQPGKGTSVILTHSFWMRKYGGDAGVLGRTLRIGTDNYTVIGVMPPVFETAPIWANTGWITPMTLWPNFRTERGSKWFDLVARLKPGVPLRQAQSELDLIAARLDQAFPKENGNDRFRVVDLYSSSFNADSRRIIWLVTGLAVLVLAIACANLASVQVARAFARTHQYSICAALGASRWQLIRPLLTESLILSLAGGMLGLLVAFWSNRLVAFISGGTATNAAPLDGSVLLFAGLMSLLTGLTFGLAPAWLIGRASTADALKRSSVRTAGGGHTRVKFALIVGQVALALVLVSAAASFGLAVKRTIVRELGWRHDGLFYGTLSLPYAHYPNDEAKLAYRRKLRERLSQLPGVGQSLLATDIPMYAYFNHAGIVAEGSTPVAAGQEPIALLNSVDPGYFGLLRIPLKEGRDFPADLKAGEPRLVVINEAAARQLWPNQSAVGKRLRFAGEDARAEVIGVVGDVRMAANIGNPGSRLQVYRSLEQYALPYLQVVARTEMSGEALAPMFRKAIAELDRDMVVYEAGSIRNNVETVLARGNRTLIVILSSFAVIGFLIALIGLYAVIAQLTHQRGRELGIRLALGATTRGVVWLVLNQGARLLAIGAVLGLAGAFWVNAIYRQAMPELALPSLGLQATIAALLIASGVSACFIPARRASKIDPAVALREE